MIKELAILTWIDFPFSSDKELREYLDEINDGKYADKLLEKDFYLTALLGWISKKLPMLSFKWWTCLNKIHFPYFRLSEDLDFSISLEDDIVDSVGKRKKFSTFVREKLEEIRDVMWRSMHKKYWRIAGSEQLKDITNSYLQYTFWYTSIYWWEDTIEVEVMYMYKQYADSVMLPIQDVYDDLVYNERVFPNQQIKCIDISEMIAEKSRAALTRNPQAIRDYYDLWYLVYKKWYKLEDYIKIIDYKCRDASYLWTIESFTPSKNEPDTTVETLPYLQESISTDLEPVLSTLWEFDLDKIYTRLLEIHTQLW